MMKTEKTPLLEKAARKFDAMELGADRREIISVDDYEEIGTLSHYNSTSNHDEDRPLLAAVRPPSMSFERKSGHPFSCYHLLLTLFCIGLPIAIFYLLHFSLWQKAPILYDSSLEFPDRSRIQLQLLETSLFIRINTTSQATLTHNSFSIAEPFNLIADLSFPWLHGSTLEIYRSSERKECFQLKSMKNLWLTIDEKTGNLNANGITRLEGNYFAFDRVSPDTVSDHSDKPIYQLQECSSGSFYVGIKNSTLIDQTSPLHYSLALTDDALNRRRAQNSWLSWFYSSDHTIAYQSSASNQSAIVNRIASFHIEILQPQLGVNLGGWLIPEYWMNPSFYAASQLGWASSLCTFKAHFPDLAEKSMMHHLNTFLTELDFQEMSALGFTAIRVPVGYWNVIEDPFQRYLPSNLSLSLDRLDWMFSMAEKYHLKVLLDLHGAPGSQNAADHSGCLYINEFGQGATIDLALQTIEAMMRRYSGRTSVFWGIELLNEPSKELSVHQHPLLVDYYQRAYQIIRRYHPSCYVVINELIDRNYPAWKKDLQEPDYYNVLMDYHLYNWQKPYTYESVEQHLQQAAAWEGLLEAFTSQHPIIVGEWSMSTGIYLQAGQSFVDRSVRSFQQGFGWFAWTWKLERNPLFDAWDVQYQMITKRGKGGLDPLRLYSPRSVGLSKLLERKEKDKERIET